MPEYLDLASPKLVFLQRPDYMPKATCQAASIEGEDTQPYTESPMVLQVVVMCCLAGLFYKRQM